MAVFMLKSLAVKGGAPGSASQEETAAAHIPRRPGQITDTLESEHGVEDEEWDHLHTVGAISGCSGNP